MDDGIDIYGNYILPAATGVKNAAISLFAPSAVASGDYSAQAAEYARQQKLADMLSQMGAQDIPVSTAGGITAPTSPWAALAKGLESGAGAYMGARAAGDQAALEASDRANAQDMYKQAMGSPEVGLAGQGTTTLPPTSRPYTLDIPMPDIGGGAGPTTTVVGSMPVPGKLTNAFTPAVAPLSMADRNALGIKSILSGGGPTSQKLAELLMQKPEIRNKSEYGSETIDPLSGNVLSTTPSNAKPVAKYHTATPQELMGYKPGTTAQFNESTGKLEEIHDPDQGKPVVTIVDKGGSAYAQRVGGLNAEAQGKILDRAGPNGSTAINAITQAQDIKTKLQGGNIFTGTLAEQKLGFAKLLYGDTATVANTQDLISGLASETLDAIKTSGLGTGQGFTDKDLTFLKSARSGSITFDKPTLMHLADLREKAARADITAANSVMSFQSSNPELTKAGGMYNQIPMPAPFSFGPAPQGAVTPVRHNNGG